MGRFKALYETLLPGMGMKRWLAVLFVGLFQVALGAALWVGGLLGRAREGTLAHLLTLRFLPRLPRGLLFITGGALTTWLGWRELGRSIMRATLPERAEEDLSQVIRQRQRAERGRRIVVIGGDPGLSPIVRALQLLRADVRVDVLLPATGQGHLAQDLRNKLGLSGQQVLFPTADEAVLYAMLDDGRLLEGGATINRFEGRRIQDLFLSRNLRRTQVWEASNESRSAAARLRDYMPSVSEGALEALNQAEMIVFAPGRLYTQLMPNLTLPRLAQAIQESQAVKVFVANLMSEPGRTDGWSVADYLEEIQRLTGVTVDYVITHQGTISQPMRQQYTNEGADVVPLREEEDATSQLIFADTGERTTLLEGAVVVSADLVTERPQIVTFERGSETVLREMPVVRHDPEKVAPLFERLLQDLG